MFKLPRLSLFRTTRQKKESPTQLLDRYTQLSVSKEEKKEIGKKCFEYAQECLEDSHFSRDFFTTALLAKKEDFDVTTLSLFTEKLTNLFSKKEDWMKIHGKFAALTERVRSANTVLSQYRGLKNLSVEFLVDTFQQCVIMQLRILFAKQNNETYEALKEYVEDPPCPEFLPALEAAFRSANNVYQAQIVQRVSVEKQKPVTT
jgi:hypothetical protein